MTAPQRTAPRASITIWRFSLLWIDLWTNRYGLDLEVVIGRHIYSIAFGFGKGIQTLRGPA